MKTKQIESLLAYCPSCDSVSNKGRQHFKILGATEGLGESKLVIYKCEDCGMSYTNTFLALYQVKRKLII